MTGKKIEIPPDCNHPDCIHFDNRWRSGFAKWEKKGLLGEISYKLGLMVGQNKIDSYTASEVMKLINEISNELDK